MTTEELIVQLARSAGPVRPLAAPAIRLLRWALAAIPFAVAGVAAIGLRANLAESVGQPSFVAVAIVLSASLLAASASLSLSVPGLDRSPLQRILPVTAAAGWLVVLSALLVLEGNAIGRVAALPVHVGCMLQIAGLGLVPAFGLFAMVRRAAPLRRTWTALLASLAGIGLGVAATQLICPINDPAHLIVGHAIPAVILAAGVAVVTRPLLDWLRR